MTEERAGTPGETPPAGSVTCCIVGGGPGGAMLALLLARQGVRVRLLEQHHDFDRDFRGDTVHPSILEIMDELGLADRLLEIPHGEMRRMTAQTPSGTLPLVDFSRLKTRYPFIAMLPQRDFLDFVVAEAKRYPTFELVLGARVEALIADGRVVRGVRYRADDGMHEVRALLTVGADGRFSAIRKQAGFKPISTSPPMDVLWFRLPRLPTDSDEMAGARFGRGHFAVLLSRADGWQVGYVIPKGGYQALRAAGIAELRAAIAELVPEFSMRLDSLSDWHQIPLLSVESDRLPIWSRPGLILIGDAAHTMSPVGGVGINYAIRDAVVAAGVLAEPLLAERLRMRDLRRVQSRCEWPVRIIQLCQNLVQRQLFSRSRSAGASLTMPWIMRLAPRIPILRDLPARLIAFGIQPVHVTDQRNRRS